LQADSLTSTQVARTVQVTAIINGVPTVVQMQVISISDEFGTLLLVSEEQEWRRQLLEELRALRIGFEYYLTHGAAPGDVINLLDDARDYARTDDADAAAERT